VAVVVSLVVMTMALGCAPHASRRADPSGGTIRVIVDNRNWEDATVFIERDRARWKIATVPALSSKVLSLDSRLVNAGMVVRLVAQTRLSRQSFQSSPFDASGARSVELRIGSRLSTSMVSVF
jgi:hypothetical protein